jgi:hypothetical protein
VSNELVNLGYLDKAIRVIANANTASLKDITCSTFINGMNDPEDILNPIGKMRL